jgi:hypothetical protein
MIDDLARKRLHDRRFSAKKSVSANFCRLSAKIGRFRKKKKYQPKNTGNTVGNTNKNTARYTARNTYKYTVKYTVGNTYIYCLMHMHVFLQKYLHILTYTDIHPPITVTVSASINRKYNHILLHSREYTAPWKAYKYIYIHIRRSTYHILQCSI